MTCIIDYISCLNNIIFDDGDIDSNKTFFIKILYSSMILVIKEQ